MHILSICKFPRNKDTPCFGFPIMFHFPECSFVSQGRTFDNLPRINSSSCHEQIYMYAFVNEMGIHYLDQYFIHIFACFYLWLCSINFVQYSQLVLSISLAAILASFSYAVRKIFGEKIHWGYHPGSVVR